MAELNLTISETLDKAIAEAQIVNHFQLGHNVLQSPVQIDEIFSMLDTIIKNVLSVVGDLIPDINLAPYKDGMVDQNRANLCWIKFGGDENYYGIILNTHKGTFYRPFSSSDLQTLLLTGQLSSWYLVSKIQNLSYFVNKDSSNNNATEYFKTLIIEIIERYFNDHENSKMYHPAGLVQLKDLDSAFSQVQTLNTRNIVPAVSVEKNESIPTSQSLIKTTKGEICWQSSADIQLHKMSHKWAEILLTSNYLNERSDIEAFLEETFKKKNGKKVHPNEFCYVSQYIFNTPYVDLNYTVQCQLRGYVDIKNDNNEIESIYPDTQPIVIQKGKNDIYIMTVIKLPSEINKKNVAIVNKKNISSDPNDEILPSMKLVCSCMGVSKLNY